MNSIRKVALACMTAAMVTISVDAGAQGPANQDTFFTFSQPVELPKTTLPAGTYFFQLMDSTSNRHIVRVMSQDRKQLHATLMAIPYYSTDRPSDDPQVRFLEVPAANGVAASNAIKIWFYPGNTVGHEFIWPRDRAMALARATSQPVLTTKTAAEDSELSRVSGDGIDSVVADNQAQSATPGTNANAQTQPSAQREPVGAITGNDTRSASETDRSGAAATTQSADTQTAQGTNTQAAQGANAQTTQRADTQTAQRAEQPAAAPRRDLPNTAGMLPLLALIGLGSLAGSLVMRRARR
jgi:hypothetical protein